MKEEKFKEFLQSVEEMGQIIRGEIKPARVSNAIIRSNFTAATRRLKAEKLAALPKVPPKQQVEHDAEEDR